MNTKLEIGSKIYYTGDMANPSGWFTISAQRDNGTWDMQELPDGFPDAPRAILGIFDHHIGREYSVHCGTRFVTESAYNTYRDASIASLKKSIKHTQAA
jgi:hypothetical protein